MCINRWPVDRRTRIGSLSLTELPIFFVYLQRRASAASENSSEARSARAGGTFWSIRCTINLRPKPERTSLLPLAVWTLAWAVKSFGLRNFCSARTGDPGESEQRAGEESSSRSGGAATKVVWAPGPWSRTDAQPRAGGPCYFGRGQSPRLARPQRNKNCVTPNSLQPRSVNSPGERPNG